MLPQQKIIIIIIPNAFFLLGKIWPLADKEKWQQLRQRILLLEKNMAPKSHPYFEENKVEIARFRPLWLLAACAQNILASFSKFSTFLCNL